MYVADGYLLHNPCTHLSAQLKQQLSDLVASVGARPNVRLGVDCGDAAAVSLIEDLYRMGFRSFSIPIPASAGMRLALGQFAARSDEP